MAFFLFYKWLVVFLMCAEGLHPFHPILGRDDRFLLDIVGGEEGGGKLGVGALRIPFHLEERELAVALLDVVYLLLLVGPPKNSSHTFRHTGWP